VLSNPRPAYGPLAVFKWPTRVSLNFSNFPAALLKAAPLSAQESMLFLARVLPLAGDHLLSPAPPFGIPYHLMSTILSSRLSFALSSKLTSSPLPTDSSDFPASVCTSELCKEAISNYSCIVLYSISLYSVVARNF